MCGKISFLLFKYVYVTVCVCLRKKSVCVNARDHGLFWTKVFGGRALAEFEKGTIFYKVHSQFLSIMYVVQLQSVYS